MSLCPLLPKQLCSVAEVRASKRRRAQLCIDSAGSFFALIAVPPAVSVDLTYFEASPDAFSHQQPNQRCSPLSSLSRHTHL